MTDSTAKSVGRSLVGAASTFFVAVSWAVGWVFDKITRREKIQTLLGVVPPKDDAQ